MKVLTTIDLLALPSLETPPTGHVGFGAKSDGLYQKVGTVETKLAIDGHTHTIAQITGLQGALDSKATQSDISTAVNDLEIGGRNLLPNSAFLNSTDGWVANISTISIENGILKILFDRIASTPGLQLLKPISLNAGTYTLGIKGNFDNIANKVLRLYFIGGEIGDYSTKSTVFKTGWNYNTITFTITSPIINSTMYLLTSYPDIGEYILIDYLTLVKGNKALADWSPAPEDQVSDWNVTDVNSFAFIKNKPTLLSQFTDNIGVASHIANKANPHAVTTAQIGAVDLTTNQTIGGNKSFTGNVTAPTFIGALSGNASSATKLQTARTIAGVLFDGTANIDIPFANLASKPTTLAGYGITDAVTTNTTQTITGAKTFSTLLTASAGVNTPKVDFGNGFTVEPSGTELVFKYNGVIKQRMLSDGSIVATGEVTAFGTTT